MVFQNEPDLSLAVTVLIEVSFRDASLQPQQIIGGLGQIDIHRIKLLDGCQGKRLIRRHDGAFGHIGPADTAGNRRCNSSVAQVDACRLQCCFRLLDSSLSGGHRHLAARHLRFDHLKGGFRDGGLGYGLVILTDGYGSVLDQFL